MGKSVRTAIVTDSTADIPPDILASHAIEMIPALLIIEGQTYEDGRELSREDFYKSLPEYAVPPTTATPSPAYFEAAYQRHLDKGIEHVLSIHVASTLSGMLTSASQAAQQFPDRVTVIDSGQLSLGLGFQVIEAAQAAQQAWDAETIRSRLDEIQPRIRLVALINTLEYLRRSGRVNWLQANVGGLLQIKQILGIEGGAITDLGKARTFDRARTKLLQIGTSWGTCERLAVIHTGIHDLAARIADAIRPQSANPPLIVEATTIIGAHIGPGSIGLAALTT